MGIRVPRTRAGDTWTEARFWTFLRGVLRTGFMKWPGKYQCLAAARRRYEGPDKRIKWIYTCAICQGDFLGKDIQVDHIIPAGTFLSYADSSGFIERMFCEMRSLRALCKPCHKGVTAEQRKQKCLSKK